MTKPAFGPRFAIARLSRALGTRHAAPIVPMSVAGPVSWVLAIMVMVSVVALAGFLAIGNLSRAANGDLAGAVAVQLIEPDSTKRAEKIEQVRKALANDPAVASYRVVPEAELAELIDPWLGELDRNDTIPIPALIDVQLRSSADDLEIARIKAALEATGANLRVDAQSSWLAPVGDALRSLQWLAAALVVLLALCLSAAVWLATRSAFASHRDTLELTHLLGASDRQIAWFFVVGVARDALIGGGIGLLGGLAAVWLLGAQFAQLESGMIGGGGLGAGDYAILATIPLAGLILAVLTARLSVVSSLRALA